MEIEITHKETIFLRKSFFYILIIITEIEFLIFLYYVRAKQLYRSSCKQGFVCYRFEKNPQVFIINAF